MAHFTIDRQERLLAYIESGKTVKQACDIVNVSRQTVNKYVNRGLLDDACRADRLFTERYQRLLQGPKKDSGGLTQAELIELLESKARAGNVVAIKLLLERPWDKHVPVEEPKAAPVLSIVNKIAAKRNGN